MKKTAVALLALLCVAVFAQEKGTFTDSRDKKKYKTVKIGEQTWMAENLAYNEKGSLCYGNKPANCTKYGRLYKWETATKVCPKGWHLPSVDEFNELSETINNPETEGKLLKAKTGWNQNLNGDDAFGFEALPAGFDDFGSAELGNEARWWTTTMFATDNYRYRSVDQYSGDRAFWSSAPKRFAHSVRCLQDGAPKKEKAAEE